MIDLLAGGGFVAVGDRREVVRAVVGVAGLLAERIGHRDELAHAAVGEGGRASGRVVWPLLFALMFLR